MGKQKVSVLEENSTGRNQQFKDNDTGKIMSASEFVEEIRNGNYPDYHIRNINGIDTPVSNPDSTTDNNLDLDEKLENKEFNIIINGRSKTIIGKEASFLQIVECANINHSITSNTIFTITYKRGTGNKPEGSMVEGDLVKIKEGMIFNVSATDKS